eukprot:9494349-Pyramimonas_sp.AAC.1
MERKILRALGFDLVTPTTKTFVRRYLTVADSCPYDKLDCLATFLAELTLLEYSFLKYRPSMVRTLRIISIGYFEDGTALPTTAFDVKNLFVCLTFRNTRDLALQVAASTVFLAQFILDRPCWTPTLAHYSEYKAMELKDCVKDLHAVFIKPPTDSTPAIRA